MKINGLDKLTNPCEVAVWDDLPTTLIECHRQAYELLGVIDTGLQLKTIQDCIKQYGVTESLVALYGDNFSAPATMSDEVDAALASISRIIDTSLEDLKGVFKTVLTKLGLAKNDWNKRLAALRFKAPFTFEATILTAVDKENPTANPPEYKHELISINTEAEFKKYTKKLSKELYQLQDQYSKLEPTCFAILKSKSTKIELTKPKRLSIAIATASAQLDAHRLTIQNFINSANRAKSL